MTRQTNMKASVEKQKEYELKHGENILGKITQPTKEIRVEDSVEKQLAKGKKKVATKKVDNKFVCYDCGKDVKNSIELVFKPIIMAIQGGKVWKNRAFHLKCLLNYIDKADNVELRQAEEDDWDKVYQYFRKEYMQTTESLTPHAVQRLLGLRVGTYYPRGNNTRVLERGYPFSTIHKALIVSKTKALTSATSMKFDDSQHRINYFMKFIVAEIPEIHDRINKVKKGNEALENDFKLGKSPTQVVDYLEDLKEKRMNESVEKDEDVPMVLDTLWADFDMKEEEWD